MYIIFCDSPNGYGDVSLVIKILQNVEIYPGRVIFLLNDQDPKIVSQMVKEQLNVEVFNKITFNIMTNRNINCVAFVHSQGTENVILIPQSNLTLTNYEQLLKKCRMTRKTNVLGITEYNLEEDINTNEIVRLGFNERGVFLPRQLNIDKRQKWLDYYRKKTGKKIERIILAYVMNESVQKFLTLVSYIYKDDIETIFIASRLQKPLLKVPGNITVVTERYSPDDFTELIYSADKPIGVTGDQSLMDCISACRIPYYDMPAWKELMYSELIAYTEYYNLDKYSKWLNEVGDEEFWSLKESNDTIDLRSFLEADYGNLGVKINLLIKRFLENESIDADE